MTTHASHKPLTCPNCGYEHKSSGMGLTLVQEELLIHLTNYHSIWGHAPSFAEMRELTDKTNSPIFRTLKALEERGYIRRMKGRARAIELVHP